MTTKERRRPAVARATARPRGPARSLAKDEPGRALPARGRTEVRNALLDAAATLFAARGVAAVSVRDVAAHAGVNHGLVHRHFGSKHALFTAVLDRGAREIASTAPASGAAETDALLALFNAAAANQTYWRLLARALLDEKKPHEIQTEFPTIRRLLEALAGARRRGALAAELDPRMVAGAVAAMGLGWLLFEPFLLAAMGEKERDRDRVRAELLRNALAIFGRLTGGSE